MSNKRHVIPIVKSEDQTLAQATAVAAMSPVTNSAAVTAAYQDSVFGDDVDMLTQLLHLDVRMRRIKGGDLTDLEAMLVGQATALQSIFVSLARRAQQQTLQANLEAFLGLALKAQAQSRATISAVVDLKHPRQATFVKQANIAHGPQQVNNGAADRKPARTEKIQTAPNELLENRHEQLSSRVDARTPIAAEPGHSAVASMGKIHGPD